jgi:hypothetical protein
MKLRNTFATIMAAAVLLATAGFSPSANAKAKKIVKPKAAAPKTNALAPAAGGSLNFTCTGSGPTRLTEYTVNGTIDRNIVMTNVTVIKNYVEVNGAAVSQPTVVLTVAKPKMTTPVSSYESFVAHQFNVIPPLANPADVGTYTYDYAINIPDTISTDPDFVGTILVQGYLGKEGTLSGDPVWDDTRLTVATAVCKFV